MILSVRIWKEGKWYIARIPELGVTTQGRTRGSAKKNLREAAQLHLEAMADYTIRYGKIRVEKGQMIPIKD